MQVKTGGPLAADATLLRRVSLDLVGRIPTPESLARFALDTDPAKRGKLVDRLLDDPAYGENWARYWRDAILYRRTDEKALISNQSLTNYLQEAFNENFAWNDIASAFITADGDVRENGATGLIMAQMGQPEETVGEVSRLFMGIQIQCAQCHDHPTDQWTREQFHELAAFFPRVAVRPNRNMTDKQNRSFIVFANDWRQPRRRKPNNNRRFPDLEHSMPDLEDPLAAGTRMRPVFFLNAASLDYGTPDAERRETLAQWITDETNPWFFDCDCKSDLVGVGWSRVLRTSRRLGARSRCRGSTNAGDIAIGFCVQRPRFEVVAADDYGHTNLSARQSNPRTHGQANFCSLYAAAIACGSALPTPCPSP